MEKYGVYTLRKYFLAGLLCMLFPALYAQQGVIIYHAAGGEFDINLRGTRNVFQATGNTAVALETSGAVITGPGTSLEMQFLSSGTVIKVSENTSLQYNGFDRVGRFDDIELFYGRIRVVNGDGTLVVHGGKASVRMREGDFGLDYLLEPVTRPPVPLPQFNVYALKGSAEVFPYGLSGSPLGSGNALTINEGECLSMDISSAQTYVVKRDLDRSILDYWALHGFTGNSPRPMPNMHIVMASDSEPEPELAAAPEIIFETVVIQAAQTGTDSRTRSRRETTVTSNRGKNITLGIGIFLTTASAAAIVVTHPQFDIFPNRDLARNINNVAYVPLSMGLFTILGGILYNPTGGQ